MNKTKEGTSMKWMKKTVIMVLLLVIVGGTFHVQAAYHTRLITDYVEKVDLNKDGKKEILKLKQNNKTYSNQLYINGKLMKNNIFDIWIIDIDTRDRYIEIAVTGDSVNKLWIYRYNGKKLVLYASAKFDSYATGLKKKNYVLQAYNEIDDIKPSGKGKVAIHTLLRTKSAKGKNGKGCYLDTWLNYAVKKNTIKFDQSMIYKVTMGDKYCMATQKWNAYKYPRAKGNKMIFTVKKGESIKFTDIKITPDITYMKVKKIKTKQTGWIAFHTKDFDCVYF